jgi:hypothetical protein
MVSSVLCNIPSESKYLNYFTVLRQKLISPEFEKPEDFLKSFDSYIFKMFKFFGTNLIFQFLSWNYNIYSITIA